MGVGQSLGGGAVPLCGQGGVGVCPRLGCHGLASPEWRTGHTLHVLTCLSPAVFAAELVNIPACWYLYECTADRLHILRTAVTCLKLSFCFNALGLKTFFYTFVLHATRGQQVVTAPSVAAAETWSGGLHTAAQVAEAPQAGPHQALTPSPGTLCPLTQTITSCSLYNFNQASLNAAYQSDAMFSHYKSTCSAIALHFRLSARHCLPLCRVCLCQAVALLLSVCSKFTSRSELGRAICSTARSGDRIEAGCCDIIDCGAAVVQGYCS